MKKKERRRRKVKEREKKIEREEEKWGQTQRAMISCKLESTRREEGDEVLR